MKISMIVAMDNDCGIGFDNKLPWSVKEDMKFFRESTKGMGNNAIVMGRKTHESIGMILPKRENIILTRNKEYASPVLDMSKTNLNLVIKHDIESVIEYCKSKQIDNLWIIGGSEIYKLFMDTAEELYITKISKKYKCDTYFPFDFEEKFMLRNIDFYSVNDMFDIEGGLIPMEIQHYIKISSD